MPEKMSVSPNPFLRVSLERPILVGLVLLVIAFFFKWIDTFVLRLDERLGEIILCKTLGFALVIVFVWACGRKLQDIGLHGRRLGASLLIGILIAVLALVVSYAVEFVVQLSKQPVLHFEAIDPKAGVTGGFLFILLMILGNIMNSFMEEGLFRGVMIRLFRIKLSFWWANVLQAFLFGIWHLPWVLKWVQTGRIGEQGGIAAAAFGQFVPMLLIGLVWGYHYLKTDSLWVPWVFHLMNNTVLNLLHITTVDGLDSGSGIRGPVCLLVALLSMVLVKVLAERLQMPEVKPWGQWAAGEEAQDARVSPGPG
jgi:membrane protease YdiL (CAAX protease family)